MATSADHKDVGRLFIGAALGFLFLGIVSLLMMRLQLACRRTPARPRHLQPDALALRRDAIFLFALPLALGLFYYVVPLQIGARGTACRGSASYPSGSIRAAAVSTRASSSRRRRPASTPGRRSPSSPSSPTTGSTPGSSPSDWRASASSSVDRPARRRCATMRAPGMAWRRLPRLLLGAASRLLAADRDRPGDAGGADDAEIDRNFDGIFFADGSGGAPLLWQHLSWIFFTGAYMLVLIAAFGAIAEIVAAFSGKPLFNRGAVIGSLAAIAVLGTLAWMQNMLTAPIGIGWMYFAMLMSLALIVPFGLIFFNLIATMVGGAILRMRAPLLFAAGGDLDDLDRARGGADPARVVAVAWQLKNTTDATAATHFALVGGAVFGGFAALHYWFPKMTGRTMGERLAQDLLLDDGRLGTCSPSCRSSSPALRGPGGRRLQVLRSGTGVMTRYNLIATIGAFVLALGIVLTLDQRDTSAARAGPRPATTRGAATRSSGSRSRRRSRTTSTCCPTSAATEPMRDIREARTAS